MKIYRIKGSIHGGIMTLILFVIKKRLACDNHQIIQALEAISALNAKEDLEVSKLKHLLDQTKTSKTTTPLASSNNQETSAATSNIINVIAKNISQPKSPCPKSSSISTVDLVVSHSESKNIIQEFFLNSHL